MIAGISQDYGTVPQDTGGVIGNGKNPTVKLINRWFFRPLKLEKKRRYNKMRQARREWKLVKMKLKVSISSVVDGISCGDTPKAVVV
jgi:hypothetical protein